MPPDEIFLVAFSPLYLASGRLLAFFRETMRKNNDTLLKKETEKAIYVGS